MGVVRRLIVGGVMTSGLMWGAHETMNWAIDRWPDSPDYLRNEARPACVAALAGQVAVRKVPEACADFAQIFKKVNEPNTGPYYTVPSDYEQKTLAVVEGAEKKKRDNANLASFLAGLGGASLTFCAVMPAPRGKRKNPSL